MTRTGARRRTNPAAATAALVLALIAGLAFGCGGEGGEGGEAEADCEALVERDGHTYVGVGVEVRSGAPLGEGIVPRCDGDPAAPARTVTLVRLAGVDPQVAVAIEGEAETAYIAEGFLPELASHPLHGAIYGGPRRPAGPGARTCGRRFALRGTIDETPGRALLMVRPSAGGPARRVELHARTSVTGFDRAGLPYLQRGDRVVVTGKRCRVDGERLPLANRIRRA